MSLKLKDGTKVVKSWKGKTVRIGSNTCNTSYLLANSQSEVVRYEVDDEELILKDKDGDEITLDQSDLNNTDILFFKPSTLAARKKVAKEVRDAEKVLRKAVDAATEVGLDTELSIYIELSYTGPKEKY